MPHHPSSKPFAFRTFATFGALIALAFAGAARAQSAAARDLDEAAELIAAFTDNGPDSIPTELLERAHGIAVIPNVFRGGFILGARRGRGVLSLRMADGSWSNPAFITLTGGSIGWQIGAESTDVVLIFANDNAVRNIRSGKFTLGGEASAVAGPLRRQVSSTMTFRAEVYGYLRSRGLYAGAAFQGARLRIDEEMAAGLYGPDAGALALAAQSGQTPMEARRFLLALDRAVIASSYPATPVDTTPGRRSGAASGSGSGSGSESEARTFPLPD